jgi:hypothetical protein
MSYERFYRDQVDRVRAQVRAVVPEKARVLVITRGDEALLRLGEREAGHFPQSATGLYAGHYPADGQEAVTHLDELRCAGAEYLVVPAQARWWLEHYAELREALDRRGELLPSDPDTALIYALERREAGGASDLPSKREAASVAPSVSSLLRALLPDRAGVVLIGPAAETVEVDARPCWRLPPEPVEAVLEQVEAACSAGARFVVLLHPVRPSEALDGRLREAFLGSLRPVTTQRLAEVLEVPGG